MNVRFRSALTGVNEFLSESVDDGLYVMRNKFLLGQICTFIYKAMYLPNEDPNDDIKKYVRAFVCVPLSLSTLMLFINLRYISHLTTGKLSPTFVNQTKYLAQLKIGQFWFVLFWAIVNYAKLFGFLFSPICAKIIEYTNMIFVFLNVFAFWYVLRVECPGNLNGSGRITDIENERNDQIRNMQAWAMITMAVVAINYINLWPETHKEVFDYYMLKFRLQRQSNQYGKIKSSTTVKECCICLYQFQNDDNVVKLGCHNTHVFHYKCLKESYEYQLKMDRKPTCPICRKDL